MTITRRALCAMAALGLAVSPCWAQEWPAKQPIRIVVPYPAGGNADSAARALAAVVSANLKQMVIVDNRMVPPRSSAPRWSRALRRTATRSGW